MSSTIGLVSLIYPVGLFSVLFAQAVSEAMPLGLSHYLYHLVKSIWMYTTQAFKVF
jgi:hypothetical protein